jgi:hypothetical protein
MDPSQGPKNVNWTRHKVPHMYMDSSRHGSFGAGPMKTRFWVELRYALKGGCHKVLKMYIGPSQGPKIVNWPVTKSQTCKWTRHKVPKM